MNKTLILVVEDDRPIRNLIVTTLKTHDYKYLAAENGSSAILEASSHNPDIVLLIWAFLIWRVGVIIKNPYLVEYADYCDQRQKWRTQIK